MITNDSDLREPIRIVADELKLVVGVVNPHPPQKRSLALQATFFKQIRGSALAKCQFPPIMKDSLGVFSKPSTW